MEALVLTILAITVFFLPSSSLDQDGLLLLSFKSSLLSDPLSALLTWNKNDNTPCQSWRGVTCAYISVGAWDTYPRVVSLKLPDCGLIGPVPPSLGSIQHIRTLDLSNNSLSGSIPATLFQACELLVINLSNNLISGQLPDIGRLQSLVSLNLSGNALNGKFPGSLSSFKNLTVLSLSGNYFSGFLTGGFERVEVFDVSSNRLNGSLPSEFGGQNLRYLNVSYNTLSGKIPAEFAGKVPENSTIDLSHNNLIGEIPYFRTFTSESSFSDNRDLCGKPTSKPCVISSPPNSSPAFAAFPKEEAMSPKSPQKGRRRFKTGGIIGIVAGDLIAISGIGFVFVYILKKQKGKVKTEKEMHGSAGSCLRKQVEDETSESENSDTGNVENQKEDENRKGSVITIEGERELELEVLLRASAYVLGGSGSSIMYKVVLEDGTALAVRRIGENGVEKYRDFENVVRLMGKLAHENLVSVRGFYWGIQDKLIIYDYVPNGSLANARYRKMGSSSPCCHLPWEIRLKIAKGVARGLAYLHDKKQLHGNLKPSNILLGHDMEPKISDFGLEKLESCYRIGVSVRNFGSKRSTASQDHLSCSSLNLSPSPSSIGCVSPYHAPESLRTIKPTPKWDVYSFGVILLELLTGKLAVLDDVALCEDKSRMLRMADAGIRGDVVGKQEMLGSLLSLGYSCLSTVPQKRPMMKEVLLVLENMQL